jgi:peptidoglycan/xylan/chitin deacetylase (PgdA/CDA1 family)
MRKSLLLAGFWLYVGLTFSTACAQDMHEPHMSLVPGGAMTPHVALTLDACSGGTDMRILGALIANKVPATIFVTGRWINSNPEAVGLLNLHTDLFQIENHGAAHVPAVIGTQKPYGIEPAGSAEAVLAEVTGGNLAIKLSTPANPEWYRGATALYTNDAITLIKQSGHRIAGFSLNADFGASASAETTANRIINAKDGDVIIAHINQPTRQSGPGVVEGVLALQAQGFTFVRLDQAEVVEEQE